LVLTEAIRYSVTQAMTRLMVAVTKMTVAMVALVTIP
jgi:hypothetical protein